MHLMQLAVFFSLAFACGATRSHSPPARAGGAEVVFEPLGSPQMMESQLDGMFEEDGFGFDSRNGLRSRNSQIGDLRRFRGQLDDAVDDIGEGPQMNLFGKPMFGDDEIVLMPQGMPPMNARMSMPADLLRDLFPGPLVLDGDMVGGMPQPFAAPDHTVVDMLDQMGESFSKTVLPLAHRAASKDRSPGSCHQDIKTHCSSASSHLHCLGQHADSISQPCRKDVGKSVPFLCADAIDKWCNILEQGLLDCLDSHLKELEPSCLDAVVTTRQVVARTNTQRASIVDPTTRKQTAVARATNTPTQGEQGMDKKTTSVSAVTNTPTPQQREQMLDKQQFPKSAKASDQMGVQPGVQQDDVAGLQKGSNASHLPESTRSVSVKSLADAMDPREKLEAQPLGLLAKRAAVNSPSGSPSAEKKMGPNAPEISELSRTQQGFHLVMAFGALGLGATFLAIVVSPRFMKRIKDSQDPFVTMPLVCPQAPLSL